MLEKINVKLKTSYVNGERLWDYSEFTADNDEITDKECSKILWSIELSKKENTIKHDKRILNM